MRETKKFKTSNKHEVEIKTYITARESRQIQEVFLEGVNINDNGNPDFQKFNPELVTKAQDKTLELVVQKLDGDENDVLTRLLDLPSKDFEEIVAKVEETTGGQKKTK